MDMGPGGTYHIVSRGGVDRGGVTSHLQGGVLQDPTGAVLAIMKPLPRQEVR